MISPDSTDGTRPNPPLLGSLVYLLLNLPAGIASFIVIVPMVTVGLGMTVIWVGVPVLMTVVLLGRAAAGVERARVGLEYRKDRDGDR